MADTNTPITALLRPRVISTAIILIATAASIGFGLWHENRRRASTPAEDDEHTEPVGEETAGRAGGGTELRRRNAVRHARPASTDRDPAGTTTDPPAPEHANDENADQWLTEAAPPVGGPSRAGQNIVSLLFRVSEDNARRSSYVHRGCACNACGIVPIRGIRYRCANCADFDLCETCESQGLHVKTHIFYKVRVPAPSFGPRQMQPVWYPGDPDGHQVTMGKGLLTRLARETGFERQELEAFWEQWTYMANTEWREDPDRLCLAMDRRTFERCLVPSGGFRHTASNLIHDRMFAFYDTNGDNLIGFVEFLHGQSYRKRKDKLQKIFNGYDTNGDGYVDRRDFLRFFRAYYVLYKQMQADILEGLDDQLMASVETEQLVMGRQPLSSLFGRDTTLPGPRTHLTMPGKTVSLDTGAVAVDEDATRYPEGVSGRESTDTMDREAMLATLFARWKSTLPVPDATGLRLATRRHRQHRRFSHVEGSSSDGEADDPEYFENPFDARLNYMSGLLDPPDLDVLPDVLLGQRNASHVTPNSANDVAAIAWLLDRSRRGRDDPLAETTEATEEEQRVELGVEGVLAEPAYERRRMLAAEPRVPLTAGQASAEVEAMTQARRQLHAKRTARHQLHQRWMLRQFYLDEEEGWQAPAGWQPEYDVFSATDAQASAQSAQASSPSSAQSSAHTVVAEQHAHNRYYTDVPQAERDAGREILYQVMQQSFNEMLDILFSEKEHLAVQAAETRAQRAKYRHLYEKMNMLSPDLNDLNDLAPTSTPAPEPEPSVPNPEPTLADLLELSSQALDALVNGMAGMTEAPATRHAREGAPEPETRVEHHDTTLPQFRPNSEAEAEDAPAAAAEKPSKSAKSAKGKTTRTAKGKTAKTAKTKRKTISREVLAQWKRLDMAEKEASQRGGWGRISYLEFETIFRREEAKNNRLDYLGSWIDFCIP